MAASLGTGTGSRVDSAAKHIMACKMDSRLLSSYVKDDFNANDYLHVNKHKFCMTKDEIVMNTTRKGSDVTPPNAAYPLVITTLGEMEPKCKDFLLELYSKRSASEFFRHWRSRNYYEISLEDKAQKTKARTQIVTLPNMRVQGVALGTAYASPLTGDTVASVLVVGVVTVVNGAFPMHTGDQVQWYFDFEEKNFRVDGEVLDKHNSVLPIGSRKNIDARDNKEFAGKCKLEKRKRDFFDAHVSGQSTNSIGNISAVKSGQNKFRIKSYHLYQRENGDEFMCLDHYGDKSRIFAVCLSGGRPYDMVDIMLMTQSL